MKIVFLDAKTIGDDIDLSAFEKLGEVVTYNFSTTEEALERTVDADVIVLNKVEINEHSIGKAKKLKLVCVTATGTNNLDKEYLKSRGIEWRNVAGYSTESVAQHTFAMLFYLWEKLAYYDQYVKSEKYVGDVMFTHFEKRFHELSGKTWGIIGLGNIGRRVADIAKAFGCRVIYYSTSGKNSQQGYERVEFDALLEQSDIVSVHAPLDKNTRGLMNREAFREMKSSAVFLQIRNDQSIHPAGIALFYKFFHAIMQYRVVIHHKYNRDLHTIVPHLFHTDKCLLQICPAENCLIGSRLNDRTVCHRIGKRNSKFNNVRSCRFLCLDDRLCLIIIRQTCCDISNKCLFFLFL